MSLYVNDKKLTSPEQINNIKSSDKVEIKASVQKAKGKLTLENQEFTIAKFAGEKSQWIGPEDLIRAMEGKDARTNGNKV